MKKKIIVLATITTMALAMTTSSALAGKPPRENVAPTVDVFSAERYNDGESPISILSFSASDTDGTVVGYLLTESSVTPNLYDPRWSATPQTEYSTESSEFTTLCAWAKDDQDAVSDPLCEIDIYIVHIPPKHATVAKSGGDYTDPIEAMNDLAHWCGPVTAEPCTLKIMPGYYDIGNTMLDLPYTVNLEGSGEKSTIIRGISRGGHGVVQARNSEIRSLTVEAYGGTNVYSIAISGYNTASVMTLSNVTAFAHSGSNHNHGIYFEGSELNLHNVTAWLGEDPEIGLNSNSPTLNWSTAIAINNPNSPFYNPVITMENVHATAKLNSIVASSGVLAMDLRNRDAVYRINNSTAIAQGTECESPATAINLGGTGYFSGVTANASGNTCNGVGIFAHPNSSAQIRNSDIYGSSYSLFDGTSLPVIAAYSKLEGNFQGAPTCIGNYDSTGMPVTCE